MYTYKIHIFIDAYDIIIKYDKSYYTYIKLFNKTTQKYHYTSNYIFMKFFLYFYKFWSILVLSIFFSKISADISSIYPWLPIFSSLVTSLPHVSCMQLLWKLSPHSNNMLPTLLGPKENLLVHKRGLHHGFKNRTKLVGQIGNRFDLTHTFESDRFWTSLKPPELTIGPVNWLTQLVLDKSNNSKGFFFLFFKTTSFRCVLHRNDDILSLKPIPFTFCFTLLSPPSSSQTSSLARQPHHPDDNAILMATYLDDNVLCIVVVPHPATFLRSLNLSTMSSLSKQPHHPEMTHLDDEAISNTISTMTSFIMLTFSTINNSIIQ